MSAAVRKDTFAASVSCRPAAAAAAPAARPAPALPPSGPRVPSPAAESCAHRQQPSARPAITQNDWSRTTRAGHCYRCPSARHSLRCAERHGSAAAPDLQHNIQQRSVSGCRTRACMLPLCNLKQKKPGGLSNMATPGAIRGLSAAQTSIPWSSVRAQGVTCYPDRPSALARRQRGGIILSKQVRRTGASPTRRSSSRSTASLGACADPARASTSGLRCCRRPAGSRALLLAAASGNPSSGSSSPAGFQGVFEGKGGWLGHVLHTGHLQKQPSNAAPTAMAGLHE